ncbi:hypothetical protein PLESTB_000351100 [Pleodorina starrii]|uniref:CUE domain-containing protein n=1 Tax=Pleodorina starrii TaxID=330485 RepID=A0A9W6BDP3_9CHLO|nr:hypothetical protein PLESTM_000044000 [Pleodorina starrii]GLC50179.1 hypothetical protein PLESTB_000351100 [Pleodorina starrii]GLC73043.1 hypothetical protein PLESTF_001325500 [Pleodorina starrii]
MEQVPSALLPTLRDMFTSMPDDILIAALEANENNVEGAIGALLEMCVESHGSSALTTSTGGVAANGRQSEAQNMQVVVTSNAHSVNAKLPRSNKRLTTPSTALSHTSASRSPQHRADLGGGQAPPPSRRTWGQLRTDQHNHQQQPQRQQIYRAPGPVAGWVLGQPPSTLHSPKYIVPGAAAGVRLASADFPDLAPAGCGNTELGSEGPWPVTRSPSTAMSTAMRPSCSSGSLHDLTGRVGSLSFSSESGTGRGAATAAAAAALPPPRPYGNLPVGYADVARHVPLHPPVCPGSSSMRPTGQGGGVGDASGDEGWQTAALEELCRSHPWAGRDLIEAVCMALQYDLSEVVVALDELNAASYQYGSDDGGGGCGSGSIPASSASTAASSSDEGDGGGGSEVRHAPMPRGAIAAADPYDFSAQRDSRAGRTAAGAAAASGGGSGSFRRLRGDAEAAGRGDAYSRHRGSALKLTHAWRKRMSRASAAFSAGDRALGRQLVAEAQELRQRAAEAHREAAERIEAEMNQGRQLSEWELDLHGLHVQEAIEALTKRIAALELVVATAAAAPKAPARQQQQRRRLPDGGAPAGASATAASPQRQQATDAAAIAKLLVARRVLRVIVGKGLHSSGGEASLPRVVEGHLLERGYRFTRYAGVIEVQLRRHYAVKPGLATAQPPVALAAVAPAAAAVTTGAGGGPAHRRPR